MRTFDGFMVALQEGIRGLREIEYGTSDYLRRKRELGRLCYEAEEFLLSAELRLLKLSLAVSELTWLQYKMAWTRGNASNI